MTIKPDFERDVFIIVPVYNEATTIREVVMSLSGKGYSIVIINDGSSDNSAEIIKSLPVYSVQHELNLGQGAALQTGISYSLLQHARYLVTFDADGQHDVNNIDALLQPLIDDRSDIVFGSRFLKGSASNIGKVRKLALFFARWLNYSLSGVLLSDAHNGLRAMNRKAAETIYLREAGMAHASEIHVQAVRKKLRVMEVPVSVTYTDYSRSKGQSGWNGLRIFFDLVFNQSSK